MNSIIVHDTYHPIVDYANLLIIGITAALAWELPSEPLYLEAELQDGYENGTLPLLNRRNDFIDKFNDSNEISDNSNEYYYTAWTKNSNINITNNQTTDHYQTNNRFKYPNNPISRIVPPNYNKWSPVQMSPSTSTWKNILNRAIHHFVHPVFRKRNTDTAYSKVDKLQIKLHRKSRQKLYKLIENFLNAKFANNIGLECILKTLCETGQRKNDHEPESFLIELFRAIFTIPKLDAIELEMLHRQYDEAHNMELNCTEIFSKCNYSIFNFFN